MKKVLVTGAGGFIGSNLVNYLLKDPTLIVKSIDNNPRINSSCTVLDIKDIKTLNFQPDIIYHLAAQSRVKPSFENPELFTKDNVMGTLAVLEYAKKYNCKVVYAGSSSKHFDPSDSPYATTKYMGESLCKMYKSCYDMDIEIARFYNVYGPNEYLHPIEGNVIGIWRYNVENNLPCKIVGSGEQQRDFIHVQDIVEGLVAIGEGISSHKDAWELGTGNTTSINDLAVMFYEKFDITFQYIEDQKGNFPKSYLVNNDAYDRLGWKPKNKLIKYITEL
tara:strand:+ start:3364 stop:4194 length:831 start_codon:yes stop_codon:yes gene_type:complete